MFLQNCLSKVTMQN